MPCTWKPRSAALLLGASIQLAAQPVSLRAQGAAAPDSIGRRLFVDAIVASPDARLARASGDTAQRIFRFTYRGADSLQWKRFEPELLRRLHGRAMTDADPRTFELAIGSVSVRADTLTGQFIIGDRQRCPTGPWTGGGTMYLVRAVRSGERWGTPEFKLGGIGDTRRCRMSLHALAGQVSE